MDGPKWLFLYVKLYKFFTIVLVNFESVSLVKEILRQLRLGEFDVLIGVNLLREGLDLPEVSLVAILDADKEGFLRSKTSLIQTIGRAARHINGEVVMYADRITDSMKIAIDETYKRRELQNNFNIINKISPKSIETSIKDITQRLRGKEENEQLLDKNLSKHEVNNMLKKLEKEMKKLS